VIWNKVVAILGAGLLVAGCQAPAPSAGGSNTAGQPEPIKVGAIFGTTGALADQGSEDVAGAQVFVDEQNAKGGVLGRPLDLVVVDHQSKPELAVSGAKRLIQQDKVVAIIGGETQTVGAALSPVISEAKIPNVGCCLTGPITPFEFTVFPVNGIPEEMARFGKSKGYSKVGIITQAGALAEIIKSDQVPAMERGGMTIVGFEQFQPGDVDLTPLMAKLRSAGAEILYVAALGPPAISAPKNFKQLNYPGIFYTWAGNALQTFIDGVGEAGDVVNIAGTKVPIYRDLPDSDPDKARLTEFARRFVAKAGKEPGMHGAQGYDMMVSLVDAIAKAGSVNPDQIRTALETQKDLSLLNGTLSRSEKEHNGMVGKYLTMRIDTTGKRFALEQ
jgi:branched-chain amino acid transport system substrate-binding protein